MPSARTIGDQLAEQREQPVAVLSHFSNFTGEISTARRRDISIRVRARVFRDDETTEAARIEILGANQFANDTTVPRDRFSPGRFWCRVAHKESGLLFDRLNCNNPDLEITLSLSVTSRVVTLTRDISESIQRSSQPMSLVNIAG